MFRNKFFMLGNKLRMIVTSLLLPVVSTILLMSCYGSGNSNNNGGRPTQTSLRLVQHPITIDVAGVVPVIGDNATSSVIYVHNNSNQAIRGIKYTATINVGQGKFLDNNSAALCGTIPAHQSCPLGFTTPALSKEIAQGSALLTAHYNIKDKALNFSQIINFSRVNDKITRGALFNSGVLLSGAGNETAYGTVYVYGSGENKVYTVDSITSNNRGIKIVQGDITGKQISSNYVAALEVSAPTDLISNSSLTKSKSNSKSHGFSALLAIASSLTGGRDLRSLDGGESGYSSTSNVGVIPSLSGAVLTSGEVPIINSSVVNPTGTLYIINAGNESAALQTPTATNGISIISGCGGGILSGASCTITFGVPQAGGSGSISMDYTSSSQQSSNQMVAQNVLWFNSVGEALLQMTANPSPLSFNATESGITTITLTNVGGYNLTGINSSHTITGGGAINATTPTCTNEHGTSTGTNLPIGGQCTYTVTASSSTDTTGDISLTVSGSYNNGSAQSYSRKLNVPYIANEYRAILTVNPISISVVGDNNATNSESLTVINVGAASAVISGSALTTAPSYLTITNNSCTGQTLLHNGECDVELQLGPTIAESQIGNVAIYSATYSGGQTEEGTTATGNINYTITANNQKLVLTGVTPSSAITGAGSSISAFQIPGSATSQSITLTYTNEGTNPIQITGINNSNSPIAWKIDTAASSCYDNGNFPSTSIAVNNTCTIVFSNVLADYAVAIGGGLGASYIESITVPTIVFADTHATGTQFEVTPAAPEPISGTTIHATGNQATIANSATYIGTAQGCADAGLSGVSSCLKVQNQLTNAVGYSALQVTSRMENYFATTPVPAETNCTTSMESGIMAQVCDLDSAAGSSALAQVVYPISPAYPSTTMHILFDLTVNDGQVVGFAPLSTTISLPSQ